MLFNTSANVDPRSFFYYKGDYYINGTEIVLKDEYINSNQYNGRKLWKYAKYHHQVLSNGRTAYFFVINKADWLSLHQMDMLDKVNIDDYAAYFVVEAWCMEYAIEEITHPIMLKREQTDAILQAIMEPKYDWEYSGLMLMWVVYIAALIGSLIFKESYILCPLITVIFLKIRKGMRNE